MQDQQKNQLKADLTSNKNTEDNDLVKLIQNGNSLAFEKIVNKYQHQIFIYSLKMLNMHNQDAEDCTSETFLKVYKNIQSFNFSYSFSSWLYRICHNNAVDIIKSKSKVFSVDISSFFEVIDKKKIDLKDKIDIDLDKILDKLKPIDKSLLTLFHIQNKSLAEIDEIFNLTSNTVAVKLKRARVRAKKVFENMKNQKNPT